MITHSDTDSRALLYWQYANALPLKGIAHPKNNWLFKLVMSRCDGSWFDVYITKVFWKAKIELLQKSRWRAYCDLKMYALMGLLLLYIQRGSGSWWSALTVCTVGPKGLVVSLLCLCCRDQESLWSACSECPEGPWGPRDQLELYAQRGTGPQVVSLSCMYREA